MNYLVEPDIDLEIYKCDDECLASQLGKEVDDNNPPLVVMVGFPSEEGARRLNASLGASKGPDALREQLYQLKPHPKNYEVFSALMRVTLDVGNIKTTGNMEADQQKLAETIAPYIDNGIFVIILGGNHETSYGHFRGYVEAGKETAVFNLDAHADVDEPSNQQGTANTVFRQILEHPSQLCEKYTVAGLQPSQTVKSHLDYLKSKHARYFLKDAVNLSTFKYILDESSDIPMMMSLDLDVIDQIYAPGVTWPTVDGIDIDTILKTVYRAAQHPQVTSFDLVELNPSRDINQRTSRLGGLILWNLMQGLSIRFKL